MDCYIGLVDVFSRIRAREKRFHLGVVLRTHDLCGLDLLARYLIGFLATLETLELFWLALESQGWSLILLLLGWLLMLLKLL
jgi:hypothetical protein